VHQKEARPSGKREEVFASRKFHTIRNWSFCSRANGCDLFQVISLSGALQKSGGAMEGDHGEPQVSQDWGLPVSSHGGRRR
jgi:hypothetical protein